MEMQQVRYFLALSNTLNFTRAAEECNVSQPALTRSIKQLEEEFGGELIRRERSQSHLTELGRRMLPLMQQCYDAAVTAKSLAQAVRKHEISPLSVIVSNCVNTAILAPAIRELLRGFPGVQLRMRRGTPSTIIEALRSGAAEVAVAGRLEDWERLDRWSLFREPVELVVNAGHRLARRDDPAVALGELAGEHVLSRAECETKNELLGYLPGAGLADRIEHEVETDYDLMALLEADAGVALLPLTAPPSASVRRLRLADLDLWRTVSVYCVAGRTRPPATIAFVNLLRSADWTALGLSEPL